MANEDLLLRQMPYSLEGEQAVLGSMLIDEGCVKDVMDKLVPSDFYLRQNREIFETIYTMFTYPGLLTASPSARRCKRPGLMTKIPPAPIWRSSWRSPPPAPT